MAARLFIVRGRVQGVWFRESTRRYAEPLGLTGHAVNLPNGDVEVLAVGEPDSIARLKSWLHDGPPLATVTDVVERDAPEGSAPTVFSTG
ncbi:MAG: acylphosphatase [Woeseiaceae bacterium]|nr:acylphosphatase [Woeseiaceae bacterium]